MSQYPRKLVFCISIIKMRSVELRQCSLRPLLNIDNPIKCNTCCHFSLSHVLTSNFTSSSRYQLICVRKKLFCVSVLYLSVLLFCKIMEKTDMRSYSDVVSGSGKFIFAVFARYLFGTVWCSLRLSARDFT